MRKEIPLIITAVMGIFLILQAFIPHPPFNELDRTLNDFALIVFVFTMILGILNLFYMNVKKISRQTAGWGYSAITVLGFLVTITFGLLNPGEQVALRTKILGNNEQLIRIAGQDVLQRETTLPASQIELTAMVFTKIQNPGMVPDEEVLGRNTVRRADIDGLIRYNRIVPERFSAIFSEVPLTRERFEKLLDQTKREAGELIDSATPLGREVVEYARQLQDVLVGNTLFVKQVKSELETMNLLEVSESLKSSARVAVSPLLPGSVPYNDQIITLDSVSELILLSILQRSVRELYSRKMQTGNAAKEDEIQKVFSNHSYSESIFSPESGKISSIGQEVARLAASYGAKDAFHARTKTAALEAIFGAGSKAVLLDVKPLDSGSGFQWIFHNIYAPLSSTMFALLAFFIASAAFRAFRARSKEAALLLAAGFIVMLGQVPVGNYLTSWLPEAWQMSDLADWIMMYPNMASQRAIMIGVAFGVVSTALKIILGMERGYLGGGD